MNRHTFKIFLPIIMLIISLFSASHIFAKEKNIYKERMALYKKTEAVTQVPWYYLAAFDQYERNKQTNDDDPLVSIQFPHTLWFGLGNIDQQSTTMINLYGGIGQDGDGDDIADPENPEDILISAAYLLSQNGITNEHIKINLWNYYHRDLSVKTIMNTAKVLKYFHTNELTDRSFPVDTNYNYSYQSSWGARRGFGGNRIHEGTDIFANYGTPVKSTTYGVVELKGWNLYGGWRIGIRDIYNVYHYYAHLQKYEDGLAIGDIVQPGDLLGTVGATGYGPPGTSGKFPPHLHYGMYKDNGKNDWSFDPFPYIKKWERIDKHSKMIKKK